MEKIESLTYQCETCKNWFPSSEWLKTHDLVFYGEETHQDERKTSLVEWLEQCTGTWNKKKDFFEVKKWIEKIDPDDPEYRNISTNFMRNEVNLKMLKDGTLFTREHINNIATDHNVKLEASYASKIWEKILILRHGAEPLRG